MEPDKSESHLECYNRSDCKPLHVDFDKEVPEGGPALALLPKKLLEEETSSNSETTGGDAYIRVLRSKEYVNHRTNWVVYHIFEKQYLILLGPTQKALRKRRLMTGN